MTRRNCTACVLTARGTAAIGTIQIAGPDCGEVLREIFRPADCQNTHFEPGAILLGKIHDGDHLIDEVIIGCQDQQSQQRLVINCHGNPIIVEMIMALLQRHGVVLVTAEESLAERFAAESANTIAAEAKLAQLRAVTLKGVRIIANQATTGRAGLAVVASAWLADIETIGIDEIRRQCGRILAGSQIARLIIHGCKVAIVGPPNSGKSTLLNCLCGRCMAVVTDIAGTTRDWVSATCRVESMLLELTDTAGLDEDMALAEAVEAESQDRTRRIIRNSDLVLLVLDGSRPCGGFHCDALAGRKTIVVLNKSDLPQSPGSDNLKFDCHDCLSISARDNTGIDELVAAICRVTGVEGFGGMGGIDGLGGTGIAGSICFTERQRELVATISTVKTPRQAKTHIARLLNDNKTV